MTKANEFTNEFTFEDAAVETMVGDIMDIVMQISEIEDRSERIEKIKNEVIMAVHVAIVDLASKGRDCMVGTLIKCTVKDGLKWELTTATDNLNFLDLLATDDSVRVVVTQVESTAEYGAVDTEQRGLDLSDD